MSAADNRPDGDPDELAGEYVLGTMPLEARRAFEQRLAGDGELRAAVARWDARLLPLSRLAPPVDPSPQLWTRIAASLEMRAPAPVSAAPWWNRLGLWRGLAAAGFAAAVLALALGSLAPVTPAPRYMVVLAAPDNQAPGWVLQGREADRLTLAPLRPTAVPPERALQLWTKADGWSKPVSLGLVKPGQSVEVPLRDLPPLQPNQLFEITLEPGAGSPTGRPTGPILYIGRAVKI
ncbi:anti-sigma factor domain-containing protein [uncultured Massilia sp.]|uniref:anti-sigma factor n=1 Tax=uncultured Massilia sp. TaxID=169973 RepID=UPI00258AF810|nr:anti-sigma factor [uncultured Massilia sp.]